MTYPIDNAAYNYRPLKRGLSGNDVYALQTGLNVFADPDIVADGVFGDRTHTAVVRYQRNRKLTDDGIAGILTQRSVAINIGNRVKQHVVLPNGLLTGVFEKESGFILGNHTSRYSNGTWDIGIVQRNTAYHTVEESFDPADSIEYYAQRVRGKFEEYQSINTFDARRNWELAAGSWNRPAWTDRLARGQSLTTFERDWIEGYIDRVTSYVTSWPS
jgi:hypothetical protein